MIKLFKRNNRAKIAVRETLFNQIAEDRAKAAKLHQNVSRYDARLKQLRHEIMGLELGRV